MFIIDGYQNATISGQIYAHVDLFVLFFKCLKLLNTHAFPFNFFVKLKYSSGALLSFAIELKK